MSLYTPPYARITVLSQSNNFAALETNLFASSSYTTFSYDGISSSITFNPTQGAFTASEGGYYHAIINSYILGAADATHRYRIYKNDSTVLYGGETRYDAQDHPSGSEKTFQTVISLSAGDGVKVTRFRTGGTTAANSINSGSTFILRKISGSFANAGRLTTMGTAQAGTFVPYMSGTLDTDYSTSSYGSDFTIDTTSKTVALNTLGSYYYIANLGLEVAGDQTANLNLYFTDMGFPLFSQDFAVNAGNDPVEITQHGVVYLTNPAFLGSRVSPSASTSTSFKSSFGSTFSFIKLDNNIVYTTRFGTDSNTFSGTTNYNLLSSTSYTTNGFSDNNTPDIAYEGLTYNTSSGLITFLSGGVYHFTYNGIVDNTAGTTTPSTVRFTLRKNATSCTDGTVVYQSSISSDPETDPVECTITTLISASANDTISLCAVQTDASPPNTVKIKENTFWSVYRLDTYTPDPPPYAITQSAGTSAYNQNYSINTYSRSNQYDRNTQQVPFFLGTPGVLSLRGRTTTGSVTSTG
jgi:hypothetical protein